MQYDTVGKLTNSLNILAAETGRPSAGDAVCTAPQAGRPAALKMGGLYMDMPFD